MLCNASGQKLELLLLSPTRICLMIQKSRAVRIYHQVIFFHHFALLAVRNTVLIFNDFFPWYCFVCLFLHIVDVGNLIPIPFFAMHSDTSSICLLKQARFLIIPHRLPMILCTLSLWITSWNTTPKVSVNQQLRPYQCHLQWTRYLSWLVSYAPVCTSYGDAKQCYDTVDFYILFLGLTFSFW